MRITIASVPTDSRAQNYYKTKRRRKSRIRRVAAKRRLIFSKDMRVRARAGYVRGRRAGRAYLLSKRKRKMRKNESGEYAGNRLGECMGNRSGEYAVARESKRNDWTDKHMEGWLRNG